MPHRCVDRVGVTLVELLVVLLLMGLLTAVVVPAFLTEPTTPERRRAAELHRVLRDVRNTALAHGSALELRLNPHTGRYRARTDDGITILEGSLAPAPGVRQGPGDVWWVRFSATGGARGAALSVQGEGRPALIITVDEWRGAANVGK